MIYAAPSGTFTAILEGAGAGLVGTIGVRIENSDGTTHTARTTAGIVEVEANSGTYAKANLVAPAVGGTYIVLWDTGGATPEFASEELVVTSTQTVTITTTPTEGSALDRYVSELNDLAGLDLDEAVAIRLINEGRRKLVTEAEWWRANVAVGPTIASQELYAAPTGLHRIIDMTINGAVAFGIDEETVDRFKTDSSMAYSLPSGSHFYFLAFDSSGAEKIGLYPAPTTAGYAITATIVKEPDDLAASGEDTVVPKNQQRAVVDYAAAVAYGSSEDNREERDARMGDFQQGVLELKRLRRVRSRSGPVVARIVGVSS